MKQQISRILNSDFKKVDSLVDQKINSIQHLNQTLTERSRFIKNFQEMIQREIAQIYLMQTEEIKQQQQQQTYSQSQSKSYLQNNQGQQNTFIEYHNFNQSSQAIPQLPFFQEIYIHATQKHTNNTFQQTKFMQQLIKEIRSIKLECQKIKQFISEQIESAVESVCKDYTSIAKNIFFILTNIYEKKIKEVGLINYQLNGKILELEEQLKRYRFENNPPDFMETFNFMMQSAGNSFRNLQEEKQLSNINSLQNTISKQSLYKQSKISLKSYLEVQPYLSLQLPRPKYQLPNINLQQSKMKPDLQQFAILKRQNSDQESFRQPLRKKQSYTKKLKQTIINKQNKSYAQQSHFNLIKYSNYQFDQPVLPFILQKSHNISYDVPFVELIHDCQPPVINGFGVYEVNGCIIYRGMWKNGKFDGRGKIAYKNYSYQGDFQQGLFHGNGSLFYQKYLHYLGQFRMNEAHGEGRLKIHNQVLILGQWQRNRLIRKF